MASNSDRPVYLRPLSDAQYRAATYKSEGSLIVSSAPGSGKTRILVARVAWLIKHCKIKPQDCIVVTFTNKAAKEMQSRLSALIGHEQTNKVVLGTFHSTCVRYLRKYGSLIHLSNQFKIVDIDDVKKILKEVISNLGAEINEAGIDEIKPDTCLNEISSAKSKMLNPSEYMSLGKSQTSVKAPGGSQPSQGFLKRYNSVMGLIYRAYEEKLKSMDALDFDDLLVYGSRLLKEFSHVVSNVQHVLVDEFQDTNITQLALLNHFSSARRAVTVVGDPDQSIYGWRFAEIGNLKTMKNQFPGTQEIKLEQTYRSSASIVEASLAVVKQDEERVEKGLFTAHERGLPVVLNKSQDELQESFFIASEIRRVIAEHAGMVSYKDFAVLLRHNAMSRSVEQELTKLSIPSRMLGGHKFFDRVEIKDILAYLTLVDNPSYVLAFSRIINVPKRGVGDKLLKEYFDLAESMNKKPMELAEEVVFGNKIIKGIKPTMKRALESVLKVLVSVRQLANRGKDVGFLIDSIVELIEYKTHLSKDPNWESKLQNIQELKSFATTVAGSTANLQDLPDLDSANDPVAEKILFEQEEAQVEEEKPIVDSKAEIKIPSEERTGSSTRRSSRKRTRVASNPDDEDEEEALIAGTEAEFQDGGEDEEMEEWDGVDVGKEEGDGYEDEEVPPKKLARKEEKKRDSASVSPGPALFETSGDQDDKTPLRQFLESCTLTTDLESEEESAEDKVTISTVHSAKGLEWPVVFVIGIESGTFPFFRSTEPDQVNEERRLLYVGMTRSQGLLYLTYTERRLRAGSYKDAYLSSFIKDIKPSEVKWENGRPTIDQKSRKIMSQILERNEVDEKEVAKSVAAFNSLNILAKAPPVYQPRGGDRWGSSGGWGASSSQQSSQSRWGQASSSQPAEKQPVGGFYSSFSRPKVSDFPASTSFNNAKTTPNASFNNASTYKWNSANVEKAQSKPLKAAPSFTNQYRLESKSQDLTNSGPDVGYSNRPAADLNSFQKKSNDSVNGLLDLLPPEENVQASGSKPSESKEAGNVGEDKKVTQPAPTRGRGRGRGRARGTRVAKAATTRGRQTKKT